jgi:hypothetical protein
MRRRVKRIGLQREWQRKEEGRFLVKDMPFLFDLIYK